MSKNNVPRSRLPVRVDKSDGATDAVSVSKEMSHGNPKLRQRKMVPKVSPVGSANEAEEVLSDSEQRHHRYGAAGGATSGTDAYARHSPRRSSSGGHYCADEDQGDENFEMDTNIDTGDSQPLLANHDHLSDGHISDEGETRVVEATESSFSIALQVFIPYMIAGFGMVGAGMVLDVVQHWDVFVKISEIFILVPALLGLKGNLEMTLASRLSTQANLGNMDNRKEQWKMIAGNLALTQAQAIVVGFLASVAAMVLGWIPQGKFDIHHGFLLGASSMLTASLASLVLGSIMILVIVLSRKCRVNPDNVATPIAASLGDLITLTVLSSIGSLLHNALGVKIWLAPTICGVLILLTPFMVYISMKNKYTSEVIYTGWTPIISAMAISSVGGLILDFTVSSKKFLGIAVFQPVINGVGGNLVAVQASRISTALHQVSKPGVLPKEALHGCPNCPSAFFGKGPHSRACRVLLAMVIPGHLVFMFIIAYMSAGHTTITAQFVVVYMCAALLQVAILLYVANWMVHWMWRQGDDPDNFAIPYLTALGDLLGTGLLALAFQILYVIGDRDADLGD